MWHMMHDVSKTAPPGVPIRSYWGDGPPGASALSSCLQQAGRGQWGAPAVPIHSCFAPIHSHFCATPRFLRGISWGRV